MRINEIYKGESLKKANSETIKHGETIYCLLAQGSGVDAGEALETLPSLLTPPWTDIDHSLADLGNDDILAIIEARKHFHLPPLE